MEIKLTNVARASREEVLDDCHDILRDRQLLQRDRAFVEHGGLRERMTRVRIERRQPKRQG